MSKVNAQGELAATPSNVHSCLKYHALKNWASLWSQQNGVDMSKILPGPEKVSHNPLLGDVKESSKREMEKGLEGYTIHLMRACDDKHELGQIRDQSLQHCMESCNDIDSCVSFEYAPNHNNSGRSLCHLSSSCTEEGARDASQDGFNLYVKVVENAPTLNPTKEL